MTVRIGGDDALAAIVFDARAVRAHQRLDLRVVEAAARQHHAFAVLTLRAGIEARDDVVDIGFDVDAGLVFKFSLAVLGHRRCVVHPLSEVRGHHFAHVGVGDDRDAIRHVLELLRPAAAPDRAHLEAGVVGDQACAEADGQHHKRSDDEIPGAGGHQRRPQPFIR